MPLTRAKSAIVDGVAYDGNITFDADPDGFGAGDLIFATKGVERVRIKNDGSGAGWPSLIGGALGVPHYLVATDGTTVTAYDHAGTSVASDPDVGVVINALLALIPAAGAHIELRNDGNVFKQSTTILIPSGITGLLYLEGNGATVQAQAAGACPFIDWKRAADYDTFQNVCVDNFVIDRNNIDPGASCGVVVGSSNNRQRINLAKLRFSRITSINVPLAATMQLHYKLSSLHLAAGETQTTITDILVVDAEMRGGHGGIAIIGSCTNTSLVVEVYHDRIRIERWHFDSGTVPTGSGAGLGVQIGSLGFGNKCVVRNGSVVNCVDVGVEIDGMQNALVDNVEAIDCWNESFLLKSFHAPPDVNSQINILSNCKGKTVNAAVTTTLKHFVLNSTTAPAANFGHAILVNCSVEHQGNILGGVDGSGIRSIGPIQKITVRDFQFSAGSIADTTVGAKTNNIISLQPSTTCSITLSGIKLRIAGSTSNASCTIRGILLGPNAVEATIAVTDVEMDFNMTGIAAGLSNAINFGGGITGTVRGAVDGLRILRWADDTAPIGIFVSTTASLTIDGRLTFTRCDFAKFPAGGHEFSVHSTQTALGAVVVHDNVWRTPPAPVSLTGLVTATGKKLGAQSASVLWPAIVQCQQATGAAVTAIDYSTDGGTTYTNLVTQASGALPSGPGPETGPLLPGDLVKVTFTTTQPTIKLVPVNP